MKKPWLGLVLIGAMLAFSFAVYGELPERIPTHWNAEGEVDARGSRWPGAFIGPAVALGIWLLLLLLPRIDPRREHYERFWDTYWTFGNLLILFLTLLHVLTLGAALGWPVDVTRLVLLAIGLLFVVLGKYLPRVRSNWWLGIRTPWTLESEQVWRETHRLGGRTFVVGGLITMAAALLPEPARPWVAMAGLFVAGFIPVIYSYFAWGRARRERPA